MRTSLKFASVAVIAALLSACNSPGPLGQNLAYPNTTAGALIGGATGAVLGHQFDDDDGRYYGGAAGALIGGALGYGVDRNPRPPYSNQQTGYNQNYNQNYQQPYNPQYPYQSNNYAPQPYR